MQMQPGDAILHTRFLFHRTDPFVRDSPALSGPGRMIAVDMREDREQVSIVRGSDDDGDDDDGGMGGGGGGGGGKRRRRRRRRIRRRREHQPQDHWQHDVAAAMREWRRWTSWSDCMQD